MVSKICYIPALSIMLLTVALFAGCSNSSNIKADDALNSEEMKKAIEAERNKKYTEAISLYEEVIDKYKDAEIAHLQLAVLQHNNKNYFEAVHHYRKYIYGSSEKSESDIAPIRARMEKAEHSLAMQYSKRLAASSGSEVARMSEDITALDMQVKAERDKVDMLSASNSVLHTEIVRLNAEIDRQRLWIARIQNSPEASTASTGKGGMSSTTITDENGEVRVVSTYEVCPGDSLSVIAEYVYGDRKLWPKIREANPDKVKNDRVFPGDVLIIPPIMP